MGIGVSIMSVTYAQVVGTDADNACYSTYVL